MPRIPRFRADAKLRARIEKAQYGDVLAYDEFIKNLNFGLFSAENHDLHQVMNFLGLATREACKLLAGDSQEECLTGKLWDDVNDETGEKIGRYVARTVDCFLEAETVRRRTYPTREHVIAQYQGG